MGTVTIDACENCGGLLRLYVNGPRHIDVRNRAFARAECDDRILRAKPKGAVVEVQLEELYV